MEIEHKRSSRISQSKQATTIVQSAQVQCTLYQRCADLVKGKQDSVLGYLRVRVDHLVARSYLSSSGGWTTRQLDNWTSSEGQIVCGCDGDEKQIKRSTKVLKGDLLKIILVTIKIY